MKKKILSILLVIALVITNITSVAFAAPFDLTHNTDNTKNYAFVDFIDRPDVFDFVAGNLANYQIEAENGVKYSVQEINQKTMTGMSFNEAAAVLEATAAVVKAEGSKLQSDVAAAQALVTALAPGADKTALQIRIDVVISLIPVTPSAPAVTNDDTLNTVAGMAAGMEYNLDSAGYVAYMQAAFDAISFAGNHTLLVRVAAEGINPASADTILTFTTNPISINEAAEVAVAAYEASPIANLTQIPAAEGLKAGADAAVDSVTEQPLKTSLEQRIAARAATIAAARLALETGEVAAQAAAETAVAALEAASIANIAQINTASGLKTTAETKVAAVNDAAAKAAFNSRIVIKTIAMGIAHINYETYSGSMETILIRYASALGLNLTEYNTLGSKVSVLTAMISPTFATAAEVKTAFDAAVAAQKIVESSAIDTFNNAADAAAMANAISTHATALSLGLTEYNALTSANKTLVQTELLAPTFTTGDEIKIAFIIAVMNNASAAGVKTLLATNAGLLGLGQNDFAMLSTKSYIENAVIGAKPIADRLEIVVAAFNSTVLDGYMSILITNNQALLGLDLTDYNALIFTNKMKVQTALINAALTNAADVKTAFETAVGAQKAFEASVVAAFNNAANETEMATVISTYLVGSDLWNYTPLVYKAPVHTALLAPMFAALADVKTAFDAAVTAQKSAETTAMAAINNAADTAAMAVEITTHALTLGLNLTSYNSLSMSDKTAVQTALLVQTFYSVPAIKTAFDSEVASQTAVAAVNAAGADTMGTVITTGAAALGLNTSDYVILTDKSSVHAALVGKSFVNKQAINTAFETAVAIPIINEITLESKMATAITRYGTLLGLNLTDYNGLYAPYNVTVQTALLAPTFTTAAEIKATFDTAVAIAKAAKAVAAINNAATVSVMNTAITSNALTLGLDLTDYNALSNKTPVQTALLTPVFITAAEIKAAFDTAVAVQEVNAANINSAASVIIKDAVKLGLDLTDYNSLINKQSVYQAVVGKAFANEIALKAAFDAAVALQKSIEAPLLDTPSVKLNKAATSIATGASEALIATVLPANAPNKNVTWASDNEAVATVDSDGNVTGISAGTAAITVTTVDGGYTDTCNVTVVVLVEGVTMNRALTVMLVGQNETLIATVSPDDATNKNLIWTSSNPSLITVDSNGKVTAVGVGVAATVKATTEDGGFVASCSVRATYEMTAINQVTQLSIDYTAMNIVDYSTALGLNLTDYNALSGDGKYSVQIALFRKTFANAAALRAAFDAAVIAATPVPTAPDAPLVTNDDEFNFVNGMDFGMEYALDGAGYVAFDPDIFFTIDFSGEHTLLVRVASDGFNPPSDDTVLVFTANPLAPDAPFVTNDDEFNTVTGMDVSMEYDLDGAGYAAYDPVVFSAIDFGGDHILLVRVAAAGVNPAGMDTLLMFTTNLVIPDAPFVTNDDDLNTVTGMDVTMEYDLDGAGYVVYDAGVFSAIDFSGDHILAVRIAADGKIGASMDTLLMFTTP